MAESNLTKWGSYDLEEAEKEQEQLDKSGGGSFLKLADGKNVLRFLPPKRGVRSPFAMSHQHFIKMDGMESAVTFNCPRLMAGKRCPACERVDRLRGTGNPADYTEAGKLLAKLRVYANVIDRKSPDAGPQVFPFGKTVHEALVQIRRDEDAGGDFTHPIEGFDIVVHKTGSGMNTKYVVQAARQSSQLGDLEWIDMQADLGQYVRVPTLEEIAQKINLRPSGDDAGGPSRAAPRARAAGGGRTRTAADDMDDVDDE